MSRKSTTGFCILLGDLAISWIQRNKLQQQEAQLKLNIVLWLSPPVKFYGLYSCLGTQVSSILVLLLYYVTTKLHSLFLPTLYSIREQSTQKWTVTSFVRNTNQSSFNLDMCPLKNNWLTYSPNLSLSLNISICCTSWELLLSIHSQLEGAY